MKRVIVLFLGVRIMIDGEEIDSSVKYEVEL